MKYTITFAPEAQEGLASAELCVDVTDDMMVAIL